jgi:ATP-dependent 26S proteasome regulatory subunit
MASGYPVMFNYLQADDLEQIALKEIGRMGELLEKQYGIRLESDKRLAATLMFTEGGLTDARALRAQVELFFKGEIFKLCRLWEKEHFGDALSKIKNLRFHVEFDRMPEEVKALYENTGKYEVLFFGEEKFAEQMRANMPGYIIYNTGDINEGLEITARHNIDFVLLDTANFDRSSGRTIHVFDNIPIAASAIRTVRVFFRLLSERFKDLPVYLLESDKFKIDNELLTAFAQRGIRGKISKPNSAVDFSLFVLNLDEIGAKLYMQGTVSKIAAERKILSFETVPMLSSNDTEAVIRLRDLTLSRNIRGEDSDVLDEAEKPQTRFSDVIGAGEAKDELRFFVDFLKNPKKLAAQGLRLPKGVLLYGPPGTGKTLLARAFAGESDVAFIPAAASSFVTMYQGSGPEAIRALFDKARRYAPSVVFIDELDAIGRKRGGTNIGHGEEMALNALLTQMDGFSVDPKRPVFVLAATNFDIKEGGGGPGVIDEALARRFDRAILVDLPNKDDRKLYLELMIKKYAGNTATPIMLTHISERSAGLSLSNLEMILASAGRMAVKKNTALNDEILEEAFELASHGEKKDWGRKYLERIARHEAGHAYLCYLSVRTPAYLTIVARNGIGGYMEHADN